MARKAKRGPVLWHVYRIDRMWMGDIVGPPQYVGCTKHLGTREANYLRDRFDGTLRVISRHRTEAAALRAERLAIRKLKPTHNIIHSTERKPVRHVEFKRVTKGGEWVPHSYRLREGEMDPAEACVIWHSYPNSYTCSVISKMPGWSTQRAIRYFGQRECNL